MVVNSECVNVFCATRPPGHHAGRDVHPMKAVSNGFCILNAAACAALHATTPISEGGPGLRRVCVIDFDVHHGNGTQDILCSTYDPRFLYVSLHAGGAHVNGLPASDEPDSEIQSPGGSQKKGIYPGRCGDTSPHKGVLNIPLGPKVTSHAVGTAIINQVTPTVEAFCPDLIVLSAGFDGHKNDPLGLGGLSAADFEHITDVACQIASRCCSGRLISIMEGGYGVPCCRPQTNLFLPKGVKATPEANSTSKAPTTSAAATPAVDATTSAAITTAATTVVASTNGETKASIEQKPADSQEEKSTAPQHDKQTSEVKGGNECDTVVAGGTSTQQIKDDNASTSQQQPQQQPSEGQPRPQPSKLMELGDDLPPDMDDQVPYALQRRLEKCHAEGFMDCVRGHVKSLSKCSTRS